MAYLECWCAAPAFQCMGLLKQVHPVWQAYGGIRHLNGYPDRAPVRANISLGDSLAGLHGAFGAVMALLHRQRGGHGASGQASSAGTHRSACTPCPTFSCSEFMKGAWAVGLRARRACTRVLALHALALHAFTWLAMALIVACGVASRSHSIKAVERGISASMRTH